MMIRDYVGLEMYRETVSGKSVYFDKNIRLCTTTCNKERSPY